MNRLNAFLSAIVISAVSLAACGGGGGSSAVVKTPSNVTPQSKATALPASSRTSIATASLNLVLPKVLTAKNSTAAIHARSLPAKSATSAVRRRPSYVDPVSPSVCDGSCPNFLDIFVDGTLIPNIDGQIGSNHSMYVTQTTTGTQSVSLPLYSTQENDIVVVEWDTYGAVLAVGNTYNVGPTSPGGTVNLAITLQQNADYVGILDVYNQVDPEIMVGQQYNGLGFSCGQGATQSQFGLYGADSLGNFVATAGYGGTNAPSASATSTTGTTTIAQTSITDLYYIAWDGNCDGVTINATMTNPAWPMISDGTSYGGPNNSYMYYYCYYYSEGCPGGSNQALWNFTYAYQEPYNLGDYVTGETVTGTVTIPAPTPTPSGEP